MNSIRSHEVFIDINQQNQSIGQLYFEEEDVVEFTGSAVAQIVEEPDPLSTPTTVTTASSASSRTIGRRVPISVVKPMPAKQYRNRGNRRAPAIIPTYRQNHVSPVTATGIIHQPVVNYYNHYNEPNQQQPQQQQQQDDEDIEVLGSVAAVKMEIGVDPGEILGPDFQLTEYAVAGTEELDLDQVLQGSQQMNGGWNLHQLNKAKKAISRSSSKPSQSQAVTTRTRIPPKLKGPPMYTTNNKKLAASSGSGRPRAPNNPTVKSYEELKYIHICTLENLKKAKAFLREGNVWIQGRVQFERTYYYCKYYDSPNQVGVRCPARAYLQEWKNGLKVDYYHSVTKHVSHPIDRKYVAGVAGVAVDGPQINYRGPSQAIPILVPMPVSASAPDLTGSLSSTSTSTSMSIVAGSLHLTPTTLAALAPVPDQATTKTTDPRLGNYKLISTFTSMDSAMSHINSTLEWTRNDQRGGKISFRCKGFRKYKCQARLFLVEKNNFPAPAKFELFRNNEAHVHIQGYIPGELAVRRAEASATERTTPKLPTATAITTPAAADANDYHLIRSFADMSAAKDHLGSEQTWTIHSRKGGKLFYRCKYSKDRSCPAKVYIADLTDEPPAAPAADQGSGRPGQTQSVGLYKLSAPHQGHPSRSRAASRPCPSSKKRPRPQPRSSSPPRRTSSPPPPPSVSSESEAGGSESESEESVTELSMGDENEIEELAVVVKAPPPSKPIPPPGYLLAKKFDGMSSAKKYMRLTGSTSWIIYEVRDDKTLYRCKNYASTGCRARVYLQEYAASNGVGAGEDQSGGSEEGAARVELYQCVVPHSASCTSRSSARSAPTLGQYHAPPSSCDTNANDNDNEPPEPEQEPVPVAKKPRPAAKAIPINIEDYTMIQSFPDMSEAKAYLGEAKIWAIHSRKQDKLFYRCKFAGGETQCGAEVFLTESSSDDGPDGGDGGSGSGSGLVELYQKKTAHAEHPR